MMALSMARLCGLPGLSSRCDEAAHALREGRSVVVLTGRYIDPLEARQAILENEVLRHVYQVPALATHDANPERQLAQALGNVDVELLLLGGDVAFAAGQVVYIEGLDDVGLEFLSTWYRMTDRFAKAAQAARSTDRAFPALLLCQRGLRGVPPPSTNVLLHVLHLHRHFDELDVRSFVRLRCGGSQDPKSLWREHVLPALVGPDVELLQRLWDVCLDDIGVIARCCDTVARERGWTPTTPLPTAQRTPPDTLGDELDGVALRRGEGAMRTHVAYAVARGGRIDLERRLWRGQAALLLPFIDEIRLSLCERLQESLGNGWALRWIAPMSDEESSLVAESYLHCQLGHLLAVIRAAPRLVDRQTLAAAAHQTRFVRNELAHYRPIDFAAFEQMLREVVRARLQVFAQ